MTEIDVEQARFNMIEQQIRPWEVLDQRVLDTLAAVPREHFVPQRYRRLAFADVRIPLGHGEVMMNPNVEGRLLQALQPGPGDSVLEIGTGSGYLTACLARLAGSVLSVDRIEAFTDKARERLRVYCPELAGRVRLETGDAAQGWGERRFDVIALTGSLPKYDPRWQQQLEPGGRLFVVVGTAPLMEAQLITRTGEQQWLSESLFETELPALRNTAGQAVFEF